MSKAFTRELREPRPGEVAAFLSRICVTRLEPMPNNEVRFAPCPSCRNQKKSGAIRHATCADVNTKTGLWRCFACGAKGNFLTLTRAFGQELPRSDRYKGQKPEDLWPLRSYFQGQTRRPLTMNNHPELLAYMLKREIKPETLDAFLVSSQGPETVRWPLHAWEGGKWQMVNAKLKKCLNRDPEQAATRFEKAGGPTQLAIGQHLISASHGERVFVWEGEIDAMSAWQIGIKNSISLPNGATSFHVDGVLRYIPESWPIFLGMDMDEAGDAAVERFFQQVDPRRLVRLVLPKPFKDLNEWLKAKPDLTAGMVLDTSVGIGITKAEAPKGPISLGEIQVRMAKKSEMEFASKPRMVCSTPWPALNEILKGGLLSKQTTGLLAPSGSGKTTLVNQMIIHAAATGCKAGLIALEDAREDLYHNINQTVVHSYDAEDIARIADYLWISQLEGSRVQWEEILDEMQRMAKDGVRLIIVDNLDHIADRGNQQRGMDMKITAYAAMIELAKEHDIHVLEVWQCKKGDRGDIVNSGNQKGYGQTFLDAANYINMNRMVVGGNERTRLEVEKARAAGTSLKESHVWLQYIESKRAYLQADGNVINLQSAAIPGMITF